MFDKLIPYLPFIGVVIGASLQYFFTRHIEYSRSLRDMKTKAYTDYLKSVSEQAQISSGDIEKCREILGKTADAKGRICLYGSAPVIQAFAEFEKLGASMSTKLQRDAFITMVMLMRKDAGLKKLPTESDVSIVLLGHR
ncbi:hypothetical protein [Dickeya sp. ws52]|uniref:hypothetical protein n=1 Tax=Dickeya sp. ws52 TaxID=2576377 RepID=UPI00117C3B9C|nr:hypothetical protein [Dickeya sp. ws52]TYL41005.1 hypothetical protein FDP13_19875 [Dickeya sp. ws52]